MKIYNKIYLCCRGKYLKKIKLEAVCFKYRSITHWEKFYLKHRTIPLPFFCFIYSPDSPQRLPNSVHTLFIKYAGRCTSCTAQLFSTPKKNTEIKKCFHLFPQVTADNNHVAYISWCTAEVPTAFSSPTAPLCHMLTVKLTCKHFEVFLPTLSSPPLIDFDTQIEWVG